jgi:hypothetical protein
LTELAKGQNLHALKRVGLNKDLHFAFAPAYPDPSSKLRTVKYPVIAVGENIIASKNNLTNSAITGFCISKYVAIDPYSFSKVAYHQWVTGADQKKPVMATCSVLV